MAIKQTTLLDLPPYEAGYIGGFLSAPVALESVSKDFKNTVVSAMYSHQIVSLLEDADSKEALQRFHLTPRSPAEFKNPTLEKVKCVIRDCMPFFRHYPESIQSVMDPSYISPREIYGSLYKNLKTLKNSIEKDVPDSALLQYKIGEMIANPKKLAGYLDTIYLHGIEHILSIISAQSPSAMRMGQKISVKRNINPSEAVREAFRLAKKRGPQIAEELRGLSFNVRSGLRYYSFFDVAKTTWYADPTFYPHTFCTLLQSSTRLFYDTAIYPLFAGPIMRRLLAMGHKDYCYCRFAPNTCKIGHYLVWPRH